jgi:hypothetical protein
VRPLLVPDLTPLRVNTCPVCFPSLLSSFPPSAPTGLHLHSLPRPHHYINPSPALRQFHTSQLFYPPRSLRLHAAASSYHHPPAPSDTGFLLLCVFPLQASAHCCLPIHALTATHDSFEVVAQLPNTELPNLKHPRVAKRYLVHMAFSACTQCNTIPKGAYDYWSYTKRTRHRICPNCWRNNARKTLEQKKAKGLSLDDLVVSGIQPEDSWLASRFTFNECMVFIESRGVSLFDFGMDPEGFGTKEKVYDNIRRLAAGEMPCTPNRNTHWVPADGFYYHKSGKTSDGLDYQLSGKPYRVCKTHHDAEKAKSKETNSKKKSEAPSAGAIGTGEFAGMIRCHSTPFFYGHWVLIEEFGDRKFKSCEPCRRKVKERVEGRLAGDRGKPGRKPKKTKEQIEDGNQKKRKKSQGIPSR